jgi:hypothetical protein
MTLVYNLRYPAWTSYEGISQLDKDETIRDMAEAANEIERLQRIIAHLQPDRTEA